MTENEQTIHRFYDAFQKKDYAVMQSCYHTDAVFSDPVFGLLEADQVKAMWAVTKASLIATFRSPQSVFFSLFFPIVLIWIFANVA